MSSPMKVGPWVMVTEDPFLAGEILSEKYAQLSRVTHQMHRKQTHPWEFPDDSWARKIDWDMLVCPEVTELERELETVRAFNDKLNARLQWVSEIITEKANPKDYDWY